MPELQHAGENAPVITTAARPASQAGVLEAHRRAGRRFQAAGVGSFVREQGIGPAVLCLHGMIGSSFLYRKVLAELAGRGMRGVAFDLPGFGLADRPPDIGGPVGFELAAAIPARIASLTLLNTTIDVTDFKSPWTMEPFRHRGVGEVWMRS